jgi:hypothetical protein
VGSDAESGTLPGRGLEEPMSKHEESAGNRAAANRADDQPRAETAEPTRAPQAHTDAGGPISGGPTGHAPTTESRGDPETGELKSGAQRGAAAGAIAGTTVGGPLGAVAGAVAGGLAGAPLESATDEAKDRPYVDDDPFIAPGSEGTGPTDPLMTPDQPRDKDPYDRGRG